MSVIYGPNSFNQSLMIESETSCVLRNLDWISKCQSFTSLQDYFLGFSFGIPFRLSQVESNECLPKIVLDDNLF